jgi:hypothetical protein
MGTEEIEKTVEVSDACALKSIIFIDVEIWHHGGEP